MGNGHFSVRFVPVARSSVKRDHMKAETIFMPDNKWLLSIRFEVFTAVTMKNVVFWDIKTQFVLHRRHITSPLQSPAS
jgi:hypothetical protein